MGRGAEGPASAGAKPSGGAVSNSYEDDLVDDQLENDVEDAAEDEAGRQASDDVDVQLGEAGRNWERPAAPPLDERVDNLGTAASPPAKPAGFLNKCLSFCCTWCSIPAA